MEAREYMKNDIIICARSGHKYLVVFALKKYKENHESYADQEWKVQNYTRFNYWIGIIRKSKLDN